MKVPYAIQNFETIREEKGYDNLENRQRKKNAIRQITDYSKRVNLFDYQPVLLI